MSEASSSIGKPARWEERLRALVARLGLDAKTLYWQLIESHPQFPNPLPGPGPFCMERPFQLSRSSDWHFFLEEMERWATLCPEDPSFRVMAETARAALEWRATAPERLRFWGED